MTAATAARTAFVFVGGGSLGAIQMGMLKALVAHGWTADFVVGSSVGAINAAQFACEPTAAGVARLEAVWRGLRRSEVFPIAPLRGFARLFSEHGYIVEPTALQRVLERHLTLARLEDARLPCHVIATDLLDGSEIVQSAGSAIEALLARAPALIDRAQASTEDWLAHGVETIDGAPHQLPPHSHRGEAATAS